MPIGVALGLGALLTLVGAAVLVIASRSAQGSLPRNWIVGIRTKETLGSDERWRQAHVAASRSLRIAGFGPLLAGVLVLSRPSNVVGAVSILAGLAWLVGWALLAGRRADRRITMEQVEE